MCFKIFCSLSFHETYAEYEKQKLMTLSPHVPWTFQSNLTKCSRNSKHLHVFSFYPQCNAITLLEGIHILYSLYAFCRILVKSLIWIFWQAFPNCKGRGQLGPWQGDLIETFLIWSNFKLLVFFCHTLHIHWEINSVSATWDWDWWQHERRFLKQIWLQIIWFIVLAYLPLWNKIGSMEELAISWCKFYQSFFMDIQLIFPQ